MDIAFNAPIWLIFLIPCWGLCAIRGGFLRLQNVLSFIFLTVLVLALSQPLVRNSSADGTILVVLADRSASMPEDSNERQLELIKLIEFERGHKNKIAVVGFAEKIFIEQNPSETPFAGFRGNYTGNASDLNGALKTALSLIPDKSAGKIFFIGDGLYTGIDPLDGIMSSGRIVPFEFREMKRPQQNDAAVTMLDLPQAVEKGEIFRIGAELLLPPTMKEIKYTLIKNGAKVLASGNLQNSQSRERLYFYDKCDDEGYNTYSFRIYPEKPNAIPENDCADNILFVECSKKILHIGPPQSPLLKLAAANGIKMQNMPPGSVEISLSSLATYGSVIIENTAANQIGYAGQTALKAFVIDLGGGFMMTGGKAAFGSGGYFRSPVEEILPLTLEIRRDHRKLTTAVVVALDRSGSMTAQAEGGLQKMDLANRGTTAVLDLLTDNDMFGVIAVDSQAHEIQNLSAIGSKRLKIHKKILSIKSMGGGIFVYEALSHSAKMISSAKTATRHIVLFADAADSEVPGDYANLLKTVQKNGISVSVIGLGSEKDCDALLLKDIASIGGGNIFFSNRAEELPQLFAQDVISIVKGAFIEEEIPISFATDLPLIAKIPDSSPPSIGGYNVCFLKPRASVGILTSDENKSPILSFNEIGCGRSIAFTAELAGDFSGPFRGWKDAGSLFLSCIRWMNPPDVQDNNFFIRTQRDDGCVKISMELDPERKREPFSASPEILVMLENKAEISKKTIKMNWEDANRLSAKIATPLSGTVYCYILVKDPKGRKITLRAGAFQEPYPQEFKPEKNPNRGRFFLEKLSKMTGGKERLSIDKIFEGASSSTASFPLWHILAVVAIFVFISEIAIRRFSPATGADARKISKNILGRIEKMRKLPQVNSKKMPAKESNATNTSSAQNDIPEKLENSTQDALSKAKKRSEKRTRNN